MRSVADGLRRVTNRPRTVERRILLALELGESDLEIYREAAGVRDRERARRALAARRRIGRVRSACAAERDR